MLYKQTRHLVIEADKKRSLSTLMELRRKGEGVEVALSAERQEDGGYFFEALWVLLGVRGLRPKV